VSNIATLLMLEDTRTFDSLELSRLLGSAHPEVRRRATLSVAHINDKRGVALLRARPLDGDTSLAATTVFAIGQLRDTLTIPWLDSLLSNPRAAPTVRTEAACALGKIKTSAAREVLARFLSGARAGPRTNDVIGEALLSIGRSTARGDIAPIVKWVASPSEEIRWRAAWALFRPRDPAALPSLLTMSKDRSALVRSWAVRGLGKSQADSASLGAVAETQLLASTKDADRRVRTEAIRALGSYSDSAAIALLADATKSTDSWISVSAAEGLARSRAAQTSPALRDTTARTDRGSGRSGRGSRPAVRPAARPMDEYRAIVEKWVVPAYDGKPLPRARWETSRGTIELELYAGDAPLAMDAFERLTDAGTIAGTEFTRVVPDFVDQQATIRDAAVQRDEVNRHRLTRGNLAWASAGLDTGRPGYTLNHTAQPHNEGDFTSLGRVVLGQDVVDRIQLGDRVTAAQTITPAP